VACAMDAHAAPFCFCCEGYVTYRLRGSRVPTETLAPAFEPPLTHPVQLKEEQESCRAPRAGPPTRTQVQTSHASRALSQPVAHPRYKSQPLWLYKPGAFWLSFPKGICFCLCLCLCFCLFGCHSRRESAFAFALVLLQLRYYLRSDSPPLTPAP